MWALYKLLYSFSYFVWITGVFVSTKTSFRDYTVLTYLNLFLTESQRKNPYKQGFFLLS